MRTRDPFFQQIYDFIQRAIEAGRPLLGSLFWEFDAAGRDDVSYRAVRPTDSAYRIIEENARWLKQYRAQATVMSDCVAGKDRSFEGVEGKGNVEGEVESDVFIAWAPHVSMCDAESVRLPTNIEKTRKRETEREGEKARKREREKARKREIERERMRESVYVLCV